MFMPCKRQRWKAWNASFEKEMQRNHPMEISGSRCSKTRHGTILKSFLHVFYSFTSKLPGSPPCQTRFHKKKKRFLRAGFVTPGGFWPGTAFNVECGRAVSFAANHFLCWEHTMLHVACDVEIKMDAAISHPGCCPIRLLDIVAGKTEFATSLAHSWGETEPTNITGGPTLNKLALYIHVYILYVKKPDFFQLMVSCSSKWCCNPWWPCTEKTTHR